MIFTAKPHSVLRLHSLSWITRILASLELTVVSFLICLVLMSFSRSHLQVLQNNFKVLFKMVEHVRYLLMCLVLFCFSFIFISWRLITLQYCSGFCHTLTWISHGFTCVPHPDPPSHLPLHPIPLGLPSAPGPSTCLMQPTWAGDLFHPK